MKTSFVLNKETHSFNVFTLCNKNVERPVEYFVCYTCGFFYVQRPKTDI